MILYLLRFLLLSGAPRIVPPLYGALTLEPAMEGDTTLTPEEET